jgi:hypothetical protein
MMTPIQEPLEKGWLGVALKSARAEVDNWRSRYGVAPDSSSTAADNPPVNAVKPTSE